MKQVKAAKNYIKAGIRRVTDDIPRLIQAGKYGEATALGALSGADYLAAAMRDGKSNDDASFLPELYFYTGKTKLKLAGVTLVQTDDQNPREVIQAAITHAFKQKKLAAILAIAPGFATMKIDSLKKGQRVSKSPYRISTAMSTLYTRPEQFDHFTSIAVGTPQELKRAGYDTKNRVLWANNIYLNADLSGKPRKAA